MAEDRTPLDQALDVFLYAPVGLAVELSERIPGLANLGRKRLNVPLGAARFVGQSVVNQARKDAGKRLQDAVEPYFGGGRSEGADTSKTKGAPAGEAATITNIAPKAKPDPTTLPISGYTTLSATQIIEMLGPLSNSDLELVEKYELETRKRKSILDRIAKLRSTES